MTHDQTTEQLDDLLRLARAHVEIQAETLEFQRRQLEEIMTQNLISYLQARTATDAPIEKLHHMIQDRLGL